MTAPQGVLLIPLVFLDKQMRLHSGIYKYITRYIKTVSSVACPHVYVVEFPQGNTERADSYQDGHISEFLCIITQ